ncbi:IucA/IucC family protein [Chromohalobacter nigrandesensis]|uniref:IucA/IucC family protein n=1 Tax=Chromohalobacter nigrandesensis TaxID=119863 RepID=UPI001FF622C8|nr:IucA/IucC family protein [Chromohalobacter nigrandesensis]MCK0744297.1 AcsA protein [Chromohalobacter nigrandesensis]
MRSPTVQGSISDTPISESPMERTTMQSLDAQRHAQAQIMQSLVDGLLVEGLLDDLGAAWLATTEIDHWITQLPVFEGHVDDPSTRFWHWPQGRGDGIGMLLQPGIAQAWEKVPRTPVILLDRESGEWDALDPVTFMRRVFGAVTQDDDQILGQGQRVFLEALSDSLWQAESSVAHRVETHDLPSRDTAAHFAIMEQWASLLDRPYHPTAKAKQGLSENEYRAYMAEFNAPITLRWVALARDQVMTGAGVDEAGAEPVQWLTDDEDRKALEREMTARGLVRTHVAIPVHPWQHEHALPHWLEAAFAMGDCVSLESVTAPWLATSSLRSLAPTTASPHFLKLPMAIHSLGASRYLPAVKMLNGDLSARLLHQAREKDVRLAETLYLCDEGKWWAYMPEGATLFDEAPRHLSAMVRSYPPELLDDPGVRLVPMATLGTPLPGGEHHVVDDWLAQRGMAATAVSVQGLFGELCEVFFDINLRMLRLGMLAEVHGQNAVLVFRDGQCQGLLLRDHDSLRISVERLERHGMQDPCYCIKPGHANTLYHDSLEALLFWLQTLAIQVNLRAIIDTLADHYTLSRDDLWREMAMRLETRIDALLFDDHDREMLKEQLFEGEQWPYKRLIAPIIERAGGPGSMPFGTSATCNPFMRVRRQAGESIKEALTEA